MFATLDDHRVRHRERAIDATGRAVAPAGRDAPGAVPPAARELEETSRQRIRRRGLPLARSPESRARIGCSPNLGALYTPHCAAVHPRSSSMVSRSRVERKGATVYERTPVTSIDGCGYNRTRHRTRRHRSAGDGGVHAPRLPGLHRRLSPSTRDDRERTLAGTPLCATPPRRAAHLHRRAAASDLRAADARAASRLRRERGAVHFGSRLRPAFDREPRVFADLERSLRAVFPALDEHRATITPAGVARWRCRATGTRRSGATGRRASLGGAVCRRRGGREHPRAGRTLADLILGRREQPCGSRVGHTSPEWEPEAAALLASMPRAGSCVDRRGRSSGTRPAPPPRGGRAAPRSLKDDESLYRYSSRSPCAGRSARPSSTPAVKRVPRRVEGAVCHRARHRFADSTAAHRFDGTDSTRRQSRD